MSNKVTRIIIIVLSLVIALLILLVTLAFCRQTTVPQADPDTGNEESSEPSPGIIDVEQISIFLENNEMLLGTRFRPDVIIQPSGATDKFYEIHSDDESILRFTGGFWLAAEVGTANLIVTASNGITGTASVTVTPPELESMVFSANELSMIPGD